MNLLQGKISIIFSIGCKHGAYPLDVVVAAGEEESLGGVPAPSEEGRDRHAHAVGPQDKQDQERLVKVYSMPETETEKDRKSERQKDRKTERQEDRKTERQILGKKGDRWRGGKKKWKKIYCQFKDILQEFLYIRFCFHLGILQLRRP